jgi:hypothetical protein
MTFNPGLEIGQTLINRQIVDIFQCGNMGGMRRSHATNTLVIISDYTKGLYQDKWIGGTLHYTGMGKVGDQDINWAQNATLAECKFNGVDVHLFEVIDAGEYIYCGRIELVGTPYTETQPDENGNERLVWMFPVRPVPENNVRKPEMFVFSDMDDYLNRGKRVDMEYAAWREEQKKPRKTSATKKASSNGSNSIIGKTLVHKTQGKGTIKAFDGTLITVSFSGGVTKSFNYQICLEKQLIEIG